ncbi:MAG: MFS transporter [Lentisphaeria bacterium]
MKNRWIVLTAGIIIQTILGGIYAWSIFVTPLTENYGLSKGQCGMVFGTTIAVFTVAMIFAGRLLATKGPRLTALIGGVLFLAGYLVASASNGNYAVLLLGIGCLSGAGIGFGYVCPLTVGVQWFPNRKGLVTGVSVAGFGGGGVLLIFIATFFLNQGMNVLKFFMWFGLVAGTLLILASLLLTTPSRKKDATVTQAGLSEILSAPFLICLFGIFTGTFSGLLVIGNLRPIIEDGGLSTAVAATAVSIFAVGNAFGRILWGFLFDRIRYVSIPASLGCFAVVLFLLSMTSHPVIVLTCTAVLGFGFGANFVIYASTLSSHFAVTSFPRLYPICFLGYGLAGITGPQIGGFLADKTGTYDVALYLSIGMVAVATLITAIGLKAFTKTPTEDEEPLVAPAED